MPDTQPDETRLNVRYAKGKKFRVIREGAHLRGLVHGRPGTYLSWRHQLDVGDVIESTGYGPGWGSDPGYGIHWSSDAVRAAGALCVEFRPSTGGVFQYHPVEGFLEEVVVDAAEAAS